MVYPVAIAYESCKRIQRSSKRFVAQRAACARAREVLAGKRIEGRLTGHEGGRESRRQINRCHAFSRAYLCIYEVQDLPAFRVRPRPQARGPRFRGSPGTGPELALSLSLSLFLCLSPFSPALSLPLSPEHR